MIVKTNLPADSDALKYAYQIARKEFGERLMEQEAILVNGASGKEANRFLIGALIIAVIIWFL